MAESDFEKYLDAKFEKLQQLISANHKQSKTELENIRRNTDKMNGKVAEQENRIQSIEKVQNKCPISYVENDIKKLKEGQNSLKEENKDVRAWAKLSKVGFGILIITALSVILQILEVV